MNVAENRSEPNKTVLRRLYALFNSGSLDGLDDLAGPDLAAMLRGAIPRARQAFPDAPWVVHELIAETDTVVVLWSRTGTHRGCYQGVEGTGLPIVQRGARVFRVAEGKAIESAAYGNDLEVMRQIGAVPPSPPPPPSPDRGQRIDTWRSRGA